MCSQQMISTSHIITIENPDGTFTPCEVIEFIKASKFRVYKVVLEDKVFAMKIFPFNIKQYQTEASFSKLSHPNILVPARVGTWVDPNKEKFSLIFTEFCDYGDFFSILAKNHIYFDDKMTRTMFKQLIEAMDYLHQNEVYHLDIKVENIFLSNDLRPLIADFDLAHTKQNPTYFKGTRGWRPPLLSKEFDPSPADIYQMGILLFAMFGEGKIYPYGVTDEAYIDLRDCLENNPELYWNSMMKGHKWETDKWSTEFKQLFKGMTSLDENERLTIEEVKKSEWYQGEVYNQKEIELILRSQLEEITKSYKVMN